MLVGIADSTDECSWVVDVISWSDVSNRFIFIFIFILLLFFFNESSWFVARSCKDRSKPLERMALAAGETYPSSRNDLCEQLSCRTVAAGLMMQAAWLTERADSIRQATGFPMRAIDVLIEAAGARLEHLIF